MVHFCQLIVIFWFLVWITRQSKLFPWFFAILIFFTLICYRLWLCLLDVAVLLAEKIISSSLYNKWQKWLYTSDQWLPSPLLTWITGLILKLWLIWWFTRWSNSSGQYVFSWSVIKTIIQPISFTHFNALHQSSTFLEKCCGQIKFFFKDYDLACINFLHFFLFSICIIICNKLSTVQ